MRSDELHTTCPERRVRAVDDAAGELRQLVTLARHLTKGVDDPLGGIVRYGPSRGMSSDQIIQQLDDAAGQARQGAKLLDAMGSRYPSPLDDRLEAIEALNQAVRGSIRGADFVQRLPYGIRTEGRILQHASSMPRVEPHRHATPWPEVLDKLDFRIRHGATYETGFRVPH